MSTWPRAAEVLRDIPSELNGVPDTSNSQIVTGLWLLPIALQSLVSARSRHLCDEVAEQAAEEYHMRKAYTLKSGEWITVSYMLKCVSKFRFVGIIDPKVPCPFTTSSMESALAPAPLICGRTDRLDVRSTSRVPALYFSHTETSQYTLHPKRPTSHAEPAIQSCRHASNWR